MIVWRRRSLPFSARDLILSQGMRSFSTSSRPAKLLPGARMTRSWLGLHGPHGRPSGNGPRTDCLACLWWARGNEATSTVRYLGPFPLLRTPTLSLRSAAQAREIAHETVLFWDDLFLSQPSVRRGTAAAQAADFQAGVFRMRPLAIWAQPQNTRRVGVSELPCAPRLDSRQERTNPIVRRPQALSDTGLGDGYVRGADEFDHMTNLMVKWRIRVFRLSSRGCLRCGVRNEWALPLNPTPRQFELFGAPK